MTRIAGILIGIVWLGLAFLAFQRARNGWALGYSDVGVWWTIIASFLGIAAGGAIVGTLIHTGARAR